MSFRGKNSIYVMENQTTNLQLVSPRFAHFYHIQVYFYVDFFIKYIDFEVAQKV